MAPPHVAPMFPLLPLEESEDTKETLLEFLQSAYEAGAKTAGWDMEALRAGGAG